MQFDPTVGFSFAEKAAAKRTILDISLEKSGSLVLLIRCTVAEISCLP
jgi:hypothetical protein